MTKDFEELKWIVERYDKSELGSIDVEVLKGVVTYINQLQQENQQLKCQLQQYEDPTDLTLMFMYCDEKAKYKIKELQQQLKLRDEVIDEAIKYIDNLRDESAERQEFYNCLPDDLYIPDIDELLDILTKYKGDNNEQSI